MFWALKYTFNLYFDFNSYCQSIGNVSITIYNTINKRKRTSSHAKFQTLNYSLIYRVIFDSS